MVIARLIGGLAAAFLLGIAPALAQNTVKVGLLVPLSGPFTPTGKQMVAGAKLYMQQNGDMVAGKKVELIVKDDGGNPDNTKRLAQELIVNDKVAVLAGFALTPGALAVAPLATEAKVLEISMLAAAASITERSPYIVRASFSVPQSITPLADWAAKNGIKTVVSVVSDYAPGIEVETNFKQRFEAAGGKVVDALARAAVVERFCAGTCSASPTPSPMRSWCSFPRASARSSCARWSSGGSINPA